MYLVSLESWCIFMRYRREVRCRWYFIFFWFFCREIMIPLSNFKNLVPYFCWVFLFLCFDCSPAVLWRGRGQQHTAFSRFCGDVEFQNKSQNAVKATKLYWPWKRKPHPEAAVCPPPSSPGSIAGACHRVGHLVEVLDDIQQQAATNGVHPSRPLEISPSYKCPVWLA